MRVLLEWIAWGADPDDPAELGEGENRGPTLQLLEDDTYGRKIGRAYIFADRYSIAKAEATAGFLSRTEGYPETEAQQLALDDSTDYAQLYNAMSRAVGRIRRSLADTKDVEFLVNVSPGYPQAQTIWFILVNSDKLDATLLQTIEPNKARELGIRQVREVRLDLEPCPSTAPSPKRQPVPAGEFRTMGVWGKSSAVRRCLLDVRKAAEHDEMSVLIQGETGSGKELCARMIHENSPRNGTPFVPVNCGALTETLLESELFGHVKGAFTGASSDNIGRFETADGGTVFLDEIGDASLALQVKLLRVIENGEFERVGESETVKVDVRILAATNVDLAERLANGEFRKDLFYRLAEWEVRTVPLQERSEDIAELCAHLQSQGGVPEVRLTDAALERLEGYDWPGNVRQLRSVLKRLAVRADGEEVTADLVDEVLARQVRIGEAAKSKRLADIEWEHCRRVLAETGGDKTKAAEILGIDRGTLRRKLNNKPQKEAQGDD